MKRIFFLLGLIALAFSASAQQRIASYSEEKTDKWTVRIFANDPLNVREYTLNNGMKVITSVNTAQPRINSMVVVKTGSKNDPADHTGLAHYLEHMLFKGTDQYGSLNWTEEKKYLDQIDALYEQYNHTTDEALRKQIYHNIDSVSQIAATFAIANEYDKMCQAIGASGTNAFTSNEMTVYVNDIPSNMLHKWVELEAERYRNPVLRLFHTELEAVYEEKNISLDNDNSKMWEKMYEELFKTHNYGQQTTIGTIEDLKNPSLLAIRDYYNTYYVPNNMAVVLSGDFDPDAAADAIAVHFGYMKSKPVPTYTFEPEMIHAAPQIFEVKGPNAEYVTIGYRIPGVGSNNGRDVRAARLIDLILNNSSAGLIDLNLVKKQLVLGANSTVDVMNDYGVFILTGRPKSGQTLDEVRDLLVGQMQLIIDGKFDQDLLNAIILNEEISKISAFKDNSQRCNFLMESFVFGTGYQKAYNELWEMQRMRKEEIQEFASEYLNKDRVEIFKIQGTDSATNKIVKPEIHPVELNRDKQSAFVTEWLEEETSPIEPVFADFSKIEKLKVGGKDLLYVLNKENRLFTLQYVYEIGRFHDRALPLAMQYLSLIGTEDMSSEEISKKMYSLGCKFYAYAGDERSYITLTGPEENFDAALVILENLLAHAKPDDEAFKSLVSNEEKSRTDAKLNNRIIASRLAQYALYGAKNPSTWILSSSELSSLKSKDLANAITGLAGRQHALSYFGQRASNNVASVLSEKHTIKTTVATQAPAVFLPRENKAKELYFVNYDMVQASIYWLSRGPIYNASESPVIAAFNQYFGGDMSSVVFQNIRESKALAYSTYAYYNTPSKENKPYTTVAFIGTQADKFHDAIKGMNELLNKLPIDENVFVLSKESLKNKIETERVEDEGLVSYWRSLADLGLDSDNQELLYKMLPSLSIMDIETFHKTHISNNVYTYAVLANRDRITIKDLEKYGKVTVLSLEDIFGY